MTKYSYKVLYFIENNNSIVEMISLVGKQKTNRVNVYAVCKTKLEILISISEEAELSNLIGTFNRFE